MIRLTPQRRYHVSNRLAVIAAITLAVTSYTGMPGRNSSDQELAATAETTLTQQSDRQAKAGEGASKKRKLNISALLFGHG